MDQNLLSGLGSLGLGNLEGLDIYAEAQKEEKENKAEGIQETIKEEDLLFDKTFECPVCNNSFKTKMVRAGKVRTLEPDMDLRPRHEHIDTLKYDIIACPHCGYAGYGKSFPYLTSSQKKAVRENICSNFKPRETEGILFYTYEDALERYKLALVNAIVKHGKNSEKGYICLKTGWLVRGMREVLSPDEADYKNRKMELERTEQQFLKNAFDGLKAARESEPFPIAGMDQNTLDYLLVNLAIRFSEYEFASKLISSLLTSKNTPSRIKDKVRDLKDILVAELQRINADE